MSNSLDVTVLPEENNLMAKEIIYGRLGLSRGLLRRMKNGGKVLINGRKGFITQRVKTGDRISIHFANEDTELSPEKMLLDIVYEDHSLLVINKPAGLIVHPTGPYQKGTLANGLAHLWRERGIASKIRFVHRLDKDTSGLIVISKEPYTHHSLIRQLQGKELKRVYLALALGKMPCDQGLIDLPIGLSPTPIGHGLRRIIRSDGQDAQTFYQVLTSYGDLHLIRLELATGRTHQIRVHLSSVGCPIVGDEMYDGDSSLMPRQALHAWSVSFRHPRSGECISLRSPLPEDMKTLIRRYRRMNG